jgi:hypothetical protein
MSGQGGLLKRFPAGKIPGAPPTLAFWVEKEIPDRNIRKPGKYGFLPKIKGIS